MTYLIISQDEIQQINEKLVRINQKIDSLISNKPDIEIWLNTKQASHALQVTTRTLQSYRDQGIIPFSQFGREIRYRQSDIQDFLFDYYNGVRRAG